MGVVGSLHVSSSFTTLLAAGLQAHRRWTDGGSVAGGVPSEGNTFEARSLPHLSHAGKCESLLCRSTARGAVTAHRFSLA